MNRLQELTDRYLGHIHEGRVLMRHDDLIEYAALQHAEIERLESALERVAPVVVAAREYVAWRQEVFAPTAFVPTSRLIEAVDAAGEEN